MTYWSIAKLVWPLALGMANNAVMQFFDRMYLAHESMRALEAVMPASTLAWVFLGFFQAVVSYSGVFVAQCHGAGDAAGGRRFFRAGEWTSVLSFLLLLPLVWAGDTLFPWIAAVPELVPMECAYYEVAMLGGFFLLAQTAASSYLTGIGRTRVIFWINLIGNLFNIAVDPLLIFGCWGFPKLGIAGAAWATVISQALQYVLLRVVIAREFRRVPTGGTKGDVLPMWTLLGRILRFGFPAGGFEILNMLSFTIFVFMTGLMGELESAVSNTCFTINWLLFAPLLGFSIGAQTMVGQFCGRGDTDGAAKVLGKALRLGLAFQVALFVIVLVFHNPILAFFTPPEAQGDTRFAELGFQLLSVMSLWMLFDAADVIITGGLKGAGDTRFVFLWMLFGSFLWIALAGVVIWLHGSMVQLWMTGIPYILVLLLGSSVRWCRGKWRAIGPLGVAR